MSDLTTIHLEGHVKAVKAHKAKAKKAKPPKNTAAPKQAAPPAATAPKPAAGLRAAQLRVLAALVKADAPLTRKQIADAAECDLAGLTEHIGSSDAEKRKANDAKHFPSLLSLGMVKAADTDGMTTYTATPKGRQAVAK